MYSDSESDSDSDHVQMSYRNAPTNTCKARMKAQKAKTKGKASDFKKRTKALATFRGDLKKIRLGGEKRDAESERRKKKQIKKNNNKNKSKSKSKSKGKKGKK